MSAPECPQTRKSTLPAPICALERRERLEARKPPLPASVWSLEDIRGHGDAEVARVAECQRGCVHRAQLLEAGIGSRTIARRIAAGTLHPIHRSVYVVGRRKLEPLARETAAVMRFAGWALLSHRSAGELWGLLEPQAGPVALTAIGRGLRTRDEGIRLHRVAYLDPVDIARRAGLPVTSPARTLVDLAGELEPLELESAIAECRRLRLATPAAVQAAARRTPGHAGAATLRRLLAASSPARTLSVYERRLLGLIRAAGLPLPRTNVRVCGHMVDLAWIDRRLIGEFDSWEFHRGRRAFELDRRRDQDLVAAGFRVIRITARQIDHEPFALVARLAVLLA